MAEWLLFWLLNTVYLNVNSGAVSNSDQGEAEVEAHLPSRILQVPLQEKHEENQNELSLKRVYTKLFYCNILFILYFIYL